MSIGRVVEMPIFTKSFANADEYEDWLKEANTRVNVLSISNCPQVFGSSLIPPPKAGDPVVVKYQTHDRTFAPPSKISRKAVQYAAVGAAFFALFAYLASEL
jgi:hypothetical protein